VCSASPLKRRTPLRALKARLDAQKAKNPSNYQILFTPHDLPCSYRILDNNYLHADGQDQYMTINYYVADLFFRVTYLVEDVYCEELVARPDIYIADPQTDKVYTEEFHGISLEKNGTQNFLVERESVYDDIDDELAMFTQPWVFINVTTGSCYDGSIKCQIFYTYDEDSEADVFLYADMNDYILGINATGKQFTQKFTQSDKMEYFFDGLLMKNFILNKTYFPDCNDSRAFNPPNVPNPCLVPIPSSSSSTPAPTSSSTPAPTSSSASTPSSSSTPAPSSSSTPITSGSSSNATVAVTPKFESSWYRYVALFLVGAGAVATTVFLLF